MLGGWNNIRMCMEIIFIFAAATGRTLVMPPDQPLYLLHVSIANVSTYVRMKLNNLTICAGFHS